MDNVKLFLNGFLESCGFSNNTAGLNYYYDEDMLVLNYIGTRSGVHISRLSLIESKLVDFLTSIESFQTSYLKDNN